METSDISLGAVGQDEALGVLSAFYLPYSGDCMGEGHGVKFMSYRVQICAFKIYIYLFICWGRERHRVRAGGQRTSLMSLVSLSAMCIPRLELTSSGCLASNFTD